MIPIEIWVTLIESLLTFAGGDILDPANWRKSPEAIFAQTGDMHGPGHGSFATVTEENITKTTKNTALMAYVTMEDDTGSVEMLAFSNVLTQFGGYLKENSPVVITGRLSLRDDKDPQILVNRARLISEFAREEAEQIPQPRQDPPRQGTLYLKIESECDPVYRKVKAILNMFPGDSTVKVFFADTRKMRGARAAFDSRMVDELKRVLGDANVVVK
mgnify:CR=1 FL=1